MTQSCDPVSDILTHPVCVKLLARIAYVSQFKMSNRSLNSPLRHLHPLSLEQFVTSEASKMSTGSRSTSPSVTALLYCGNHECSLSFPPLASSSTCSSSLKRERSPDSSPPPSDNELLYNHKKHVTIQSNVIVSFLPPLVNRHERHKQVFEPNEFLSSSKHYVHSNDHQWENDTLLKYSIDNKIQMAFQVFLECFYGICGFVPYWDREEEPSVTVTAAPTSRNDRKKAVEEYWTKSLKDNSGVYKKDLKFLEGSQSGYKESHEYVHSMSIAAVAAGMSKYERVFSLGERRSKIYRRIWEHMTGHQEYKDSMEDSRLMTPKGIETVKEDNIYGDYLSSDEDVEQAT